MTQRTATGETRQSAQKGSRFERIFTDKKKKTNNVWKRIDQCPVAPQTFLEEPHGRGRSARRYKEISSWSAAP